MAVIIDHKFAVAPEMLWEILGAPDRVDWVPGVTPFSLSNANEALDFEQRGLCHMVMRFTDRSPLGRLRDSKSTLILIEGVA